MRRTIESASVEQRLFTVRNEKELESLYVEQFLKMSTEENSKLNVLPHLGSELRSAIVEVQKQPWPEAVKEQAICERRERDESALP